MSLKERVYSVLVISAAKNFNSTLTTLLLESTYSPIHIVPSVSTAKRVVAERAFDFVLINSPLLDDSGTRFAIGTCASKGTVVLFLVRNDIYAEIYDRVTEYGVFTLSKLISKQAMDRCISKREVAQEIIKMYS